MKNLVKFINKVEIIDTDSISSLKKVDTGKISVSFSSDPKELCTVGLSQLEISDKIENKVRLVTAKLSAIIVNDIDICNRKLAFRLTSTDGSVYLVGDKIRPFPVINISELLPSLASNSTKRTLTVSCTSKAPIGEIVA